MNTPIVSPLAIYFITTLCDIKVLCWIVSGCLLTAGCIIAFVGFVDEKNLAKTYKPMFLAGLPILCLGFLIPSRESATLMVASAYATPSNIMAVGNSIKGWIDYVATLFQ